MNQVDHLAHSANEAGYVDPLRVHLQDVAHRAAEYAEAFGASEEAMIAGLLHDLGKYGDLFQRRLEGKERGIDHWSAGAWEALTKYKQQGIASALAIQGHHIGLQQASKDSLALLNPQRLQKYHPLGLRLSDPKVDVLQQRMKADNLQPDFITTSIYPGVKEASEQKQTVASMFDVRMLYSALVDADFIETEAHFQGNPDGSKNYREVGLSLEAKQALPHLVGYLDELARQSKASSHVNQLRADLLNTCLEAGSLPQGLFTLTAPTGTGKTLSMLAFALKHAAEHDLRRVIIVIPYLSIIEQTVKEYRKVFEPHWGSEDVKRYILEHHSLAGTRAKEGGEGAEVDMEDEARRRARLLSENWDAPLIVTTSVQLLESLFADRPSACRKLHRLAKSVILFDEVQALPVSLAVPTLATLSRVVERYGSTVIFSTATQPAFGHLDNYVKDYCAVGWKPREIVLPSLNLFQRAERTQVEWPNLSQSTSWTELAERLAEGKQALCIVNLKNHALLLYDKLHQLSVEGLFHLSTNMCPVHRQVVLEEVRKRLQRKQPCLLISTQCVEAGVDVDFPVVYRAFGPLDAIAQAAGRCNRNGHKKTGPVHVFLPEEEKYPDGTYRQAAGVTRLLLQKHTKEDMDLHSPLLFEEYYHELYDLVKPQNRKKELTEAILRQDFQEVSRLYRVIDQDAINVLVPYDSDVFQRLEKEVRETGLNGKWIAKARPHTIGLFRPKLHDPVRSYLDPLPLGKGNHSEEWFIYLKEEHYDREAKGLVLPT